MINTTTAYVKGTHQPACPLDNPTKIVDWVLCQPSQAVMVDLETSVGKVLAEVLDTLQIVVVATTGEVVHYG